MSTTVHQPTRNRPLGCLLQLAGWLLVGGAGVGLLVSRSGFSSGTGLLLSFLFGAGFFVLGAIGVAVVRRGKQLASRDAKQLLAERGKGVVAYLRSFRDDGSGSDDSNLSDLPAVTRSDEENLARALSPIGPMVAVGKPGEKLAELGAARLYVSDDDWQAEVDDLLERSSLVVLRIGSTPGFWWEVSRAIQRVPPEKILFFLGRPGPSSSAWRTFRDRAQEVLPTMLPEMVLGASFLFFHSDWTPGLLHLDDRERRVDRAFADTLDPVLTRSRKALPRAGDGDACESITPGTSGGTPAKSALASSTTASARPRTRLRGIVMLAVGAFISVVTLGIPLALGLGGRVRGPSPVILLPLAVGGCLWAGGLVAIMEGRRLQYQGLALQALAFFMICIFTPALIAGAWVLLAY